MQPALNTASAKVAYELYSAERGTLSVHPSLSAAVAALWLDRTSVPPPPDAAQIFEVRGDHARIIEPEEYSFL